MVDGASYGKSSIFPWEGLYVIMEKITETNYKISLQSQEDARWQIVHYNRL
jgi:hypothetical protein